MIEVVRHCLDRRRPLLETDPTLYFIET